MLTVLVSVVLTVATLAGMTLMILSDSFRTVDGLFFTLILGSMSAILAFNSFHTVRRLRALRVSAQSSASTSGVASPAHPVKSARRSKEKARSIEGLATCSVLIRSDAPIPNVVRTQQHGKWNLIECASAAALERTLSESGLNIFFPVGAITGSGLALSCKDAVTKALGSVLSAVEAQGRNALEIAHIGTVNVLGLHYVTVVAHARHIQKAALFLEPAATSPAAQSPSASAGSPRRWFRFHRPKP